MINNRNEKVVDANKPSLLDVNKNVLKIIIGQQSGLQLKDFAHLSQSCKTLNTLFQPVISAQKLVEHILHGEQDEAEAMLKQALKAGPEKLKALLTQSVTAIDYSGRTIEKATALQAALGAEDDLMVAMILPYFEQIEGGFSIALKQWDEQFPETSPLESPESWDTLTPMPNLAQDPVKPGKLEMQIQATNEGLVYRACINQKIVNDLIPWDQLPHEFPKNFQSVKEVQSYLPEILTGVAKNGHTLSYDFSQLVAAINNNRNNLKLGVEEALIQFRNDLKPCVIKTGKHFDIRMLIDALKVYEPNYRPWDGDQHSLFSRKIYGYLQRLVSTPLAQTFATGLYKVAEEGQKVKRVLNLANDKEFAYFPLGLNQSSRLGFDVYIAGWGWPVRAVVCGVDAGVGPARIQKLCRAKASKFSELKNNLRESIQDKPKQELK